MKRTRRQWLKRGLVFVPATFGIVKAQGVFVRSPAFRTQAATSSGPPSTNLVQHLKADAVSGTDGTDITTWTATVGKDATGSAGETGKIYNNVKNGLPVIRFDGSNDTMGTVNFDSSLSQPYCVFVVYKLANNDVNHRLLSNNAENGGNRFVMRIDNAPAVQIYGGSAFVAIGDGNTNWNIVSMEVNGTSTKGRINGGTEDTLSDPGTGILAGLRISGDYDGTVNPAAADVGEILIYSSTIPDKTSHFSYLNTRWAVY